MHKIEVGQKVWVVECGPNAGRRGGVREPMEAVVSKVGKKWFNVEGGRFERYRFSLVDLINDGGAYSSDYRIIVDMEEEARQKHLQKLKTEIKREFTNWNFPNLSDEQIEAIHKIMFPEK